MAAAVEPANALTDRLRCHHCQGKRKSDVYC